MPWQLNMLAEIDNHKGQLVKRAEEFVQTSGIHNVSEKKLGNRQLSNLLGIAILEKDMAVVTNFIRYRIELLSPLHIGSGLFALAEDCGFNQEGVVQGIAGFDRSTGIHPSR